MRNKDSITKSRVDGQSSTPDQLALRLQEIYFGRTLSVLLGMRHFIHVVGALSGSLLTYFPPLYVPFLFSPAVGGPSANAAVGLAPGVASFIGPRLCECNLNASSPWDCVQQNERLLMSSMPFRDNVREAISGFKYIQSKAPLLRALDTPFGVTVYFACPETGGDVLPGSVYSDNILNPTIGQAFSMDVIVVDHLPDDSLCSQVAKDLEAVLQFILPKRSKLRVRRFKSAEEAFVHLALARRLICPPEPMPSLCFWAAVAGFEALVAPKGLPLRPALPEHVKVYRHPVMDAQKALSQTPHAILNWIKSN